MANTYYNSQLTGAQIEQALKAINGVIIPANNGKVLAINNGKIEARSVQWGGGEPTGTVQISSNGTHDVKQYAYAEVNVQLPSATGEEF